MSLLDDAFVDARELRRQAITNGLLAAKYRDKKICEHLIKEEEAWKNRHINRFKDMIEENNEDADIQQE